MAQTDRIEPLSFGEKQKVTHKVTSGDTCCAWVSRVSKSMHAVPAMPATPLLGATAGLGINPV